MCIYAAHPYSNAFSLGSIQTYTYDQWRPLPTPPAGTPTSTGSSSASGSGSAGSGGGLGGGGDAGSVGGDAPEDVDVSMAGVERVAKEQMEESASSTFPSRGTWGDGIEEIDDPWSDATVSDSIDELDIFHKMVSLSYT